MNGMIIHEQGIPLNLCLAESSLHIRFLGSQVGQFLFAILLLDITSIIYHHENHDINLILIFFVCLCVSQMLLFFVRLHVAVSWTSFECCKM
jgi:hypothetical protein